MPKVVVGPDVVYRSADKLGAGVTLSTDGGSDLGYYQAPSMRLGVALGGVSLSAGGCIRFADNLDSMHLYLTAVRTFGASNWNSDTWLGPEFVLTAGFLKVFVGKLQRIGGDHAARWQFGGGVAWGL